MASLKIVGKVTHWPNQNGVQFDFQKIDEKKSKDGEDVVSFGNTDIPFEIWQRFKGNKVKITIEKVK